MADTATLLAEAESARHRLLTGSQAEEVHFQGRMVRFTPVDLLRLDAYIDQLKGDLGQAQSRNFVVQTNRGFR